jgi:hypothetical protein
MAKRKRGRRKTARRNSARKKKSIRRPRTTAIKHFLNTSEREIRKLGKATKKLTNKAIAKIRSLKYV